MIIFGILFLIGVVIIVGFIGTLIYAGIQKNKPENIEKRRIAQNKKEHQEREDREKYGD